MDLQFRPLQHDDLPSLERWLAEPHVERWWHERLDAEALREKYEPRIEGRVPVHVFVIDWGARPIGFIQWYRWSDFEEHATRLGATSTEAGLDLAIGEPDQIGLGLGPRVIRSFCEEILLADRSITACVSDPEEANMRSVRAFEKAGFVGAGTVLLPGESARRCVMRLIPRGGT